MSDAARRILLGILLLGVIGVMAELLLLAHTEDATQWIPIALGGATLVLSAVVAVRPSRGSIRLFQVVMLLMIVSGAVGMYLHLRANMEFQLEMDATQEDLGNDDGASQAPTQGDGAGDASEDE